MNVILVTKQFEIILVDLPQLCFDTLGHLLEMLCSELLNLAPAVHVRPLRLHLFCLLVVFLPIFFIGVHLAQPQLGRDASVVLTECVHGGDDGVVDRAERAGHVHGAPVMVVHAGAAPVAAGVVVLQDGVP